MAQAPRSLACQTPEWLGRTSRGGQTMASDESTGTNKCSNRSSQNRFATPKLVKRTN